MVVAMYVGSLLLGFGLLVFFGDKLVDNAAAIAQKWNIPSSVIAVTLLAAGTSAPELVTSFLAALQHATDISIGNVVGSNIFNLMAVGGLAIVLRPKGDNRSAFFTWPPLLICTGAFAYFLSDLFLSRTEGFLMLGLTVGFILYSLKTQNKKSFEDDTDEDVEAAASVGKMALFTIVSFTGLIAGAQLALYGGVGLGELAGLSERTIGITIISVGTGLPELATSIAAVLKGRNDMAIGNIIGSNIYNTVGIPGVTAATLPLSASASLWFPDTAMMLVPTVLIGLVFLFRHPMIVRGVGFIFLAGYLAYMAHFFQ